MTATGLAPRQVTVDGTTRKAGRKRTAGASWLGRGMVLPALLLTGVLVGYPLVRGIMMSLQAGGVATGTPAHYVGMRNYRDVFTDPGTKTAAIHTLFYLLIAVSLEIVGGLIVAVTLQRAFRGRGLVLAILILPWALPSVVSGVLWRRILDPDSGLLNRALMSLHVIDTPHIWLASDRLGIFFISLVHVWGLIPLVSLVLLAGLQSIPEELYDASAVDGASAIRQFRHITLPLLRPALVIALTVGTLAAMSIFDEVYVLNGTALNTRSLLMQVYDTTFNQADFSHGIALAMMVAVASATLAIIFGLLLRRVTR
ncbi:MAG: sugar ABC transporter permease [Pseudonocardiales bacterium]|nr:MAG: sugar ABC transporter permease [Pseudonocardiales bacterium]